MVPDHGPSSDLHRPQSHLQRVPQHSHRHRTHRRQPGAYTPILHAICMHLLSLRPGSVWSLGSRWSPRCSRLSPRSFRCRSLGQAAPQQLGRCCVPQSLPGEQGHHGRLEDAGARRGSEGQRPGSVAAQEHRGRSGGQLHGQGGAGARRARGGAHARSLTNGGASTVTNE